MASLITRMLSRFKTQKRSRRNRRQLDRRLRVEHMEARRLLAADLAVISGNVYTDLTDNGRDASDVAISGITVSLFRDDGNGIFDANTDTLVQTAVTDANGNFIFDGVSSASDTTDALYFVQQSPAPGQLQRPTESVQAVTVTPAMANGDMATNIDNYNTTPVSTHPDPIKAAAGVTEEDQAATAPGEALGDERDILVINTTSSGTPTLDVSVDSGLLSISAGPGVEGHVIVSYDGVDGSADTLDHTTLPLTDLTANGGEAFQFFVGSEAGNSLTVSVYSGGSNYSSVTVPLPTTTGGLATEFLTIPFADLVIENGTGADLAQITAVRFQVDVVAGADAQINFTSVVGPNVSTVNFANLNPMSLGDQVFRDVNNNGLFDAGEVGIAGVLVELYEDTNGNGAYDAGDTLVGAPQTTGADGKYLFTDLFPGSYIALIPISQFGAGEALEGFVTSTGNDPAPDPDNDIDGDDNGTLIAGVGVATGAITLTAGGEPTDNNTNTTLDFGFVPQFDLEVVKTADVSTVLAGNEITYTLTVSNNGLADATNVLIVDNLPDLAPDELVIVSATASGGGVVTQTGDASGELEIAYAALAAGQTETVTIVVRVPPAAAAAAAITNTATITGEGIDTDPSNDQDSIDVAVTRQATLTIDKSDAPDPNTVGGTLTYEILVTNTGPSTATNVVVTDPLPAGLTYSSSTTTAGTVAEATGVVTATIPSLAPGASATVTIVTTIQAGFAGSTIPNSATAEADEAEQVTGNASTVVNPDIDLQITKSDSDDPVNRGGVLTYTLTVFNDGPSGATNVEVIDTLPPDVTFVSATGGTVTSGTVGSSDPVTIDLGNMASQETKVITLTVNVAAAAAATFNNTAEVRSTESLAGFDRDMTNNQDVESTAAQSQIDLELVKSDAADPVKPGEALVYTIIVTNHGPSDATQVRMTDNLPDGIRITSATSSVGTVTIPASAQDTNPTNNDDLIVDIGNLASGATTTITVNAVVLPGTTGTLTNTATVATTDASLIDINPDNNTDTETTTLTPEIDLAITKTDSIDPAIAGSPLTYTITVTNDGPSTATNVALTDNLPTGVTFTSATSSQGTVTHTAGVVSGNLGTLAPGASATVTLLVGVNSATRGTITNTASVTAAETDSDPSNNSASQATDITGRVDLAITKVDSVDPVVAGSALSYTIVVTNNGPSTATGVVVSDTLPSSLIYVSGNSSVGSVTNAGNVVTANVGTLASGASATITLNTTVAAGTTGTISNTASVTQAETDTNPGNNSATQTTNIAVPGSISGFAYLDVNRSGVRDPGDTPLSNVTVTLTGTEAGSGVAVNRQTTTDANGGYSFGNVLPGTYKLSQTPPAGLRSGQTNVGTGATGTPGVNEITNIQLGSGAEAEAFNFGALREELSKRRFLASTDPAGF